MRIALLTDGLFPYKIGGIQKHSLFLAQHLAEVGVDVTVFFSHDSSQELVPSPVDLVKSIGQERLEFVPVAHPRALYFPGHFIWESWRISKLFFELLERSGPFDLIFAQGFAGWYAVSRRHRGKLGCPVGVHPHGLEMFQKPNSFRTAIQQEFLRLAMRRNLVLADCVFALGKGMEGILQQNGCSSKIYLSPNGIGVEWLQDTALVDSETSLQFLFVGRYERRKGLPELSRVISLLLEQGLNFTFHFVGPVPVQHQIQSDSVRYWGEIRDEPKLREIFSACDVLVCPSHSEGMPTVILEGMASGLAILATRVGAVPDMVSDANGWLIPPMSESALQVAMIEVISCESEILRQKKKASKAIVKESFLWNSVAQTTLNEIRRVIHHYSLNEEQIV